MPGFEFATVNRGFSVRTDSKTRQWQGIVGRERHEGLSHENINGSVVPIAYNFLGAAAMDKSKPVFASIIKADIGGIGGHVLVHPSVLRKVQEHIFAESRDLISAFFVSGAGDDVSINMIHQRGLNSAD